MSQDDVQDDDGNVVEVRGCWWNIRKRCMVRRQDGRCQCSE